MFATELHLATSPPPDWRLVRWDLFVFADIRDVLPGTRPGTVVVIHTGRARVEEWLQELRSAGLTAS